MPEQDQDKRRWGIALYYVGGGAVCLLALFAAVHGSPWYEVVLMLCVGLLIMHAPVRRIFGARVSRSGDEIVCRYLPLYEGNAYLGCILLPVFGVAAVAGGSAPGNPAWWRAGGIVLLVISLLVIFSHLRMGRRCLLVFNPSKLRVRGAACRGQGAALAEIYRNEIQAIEQLRVGRARSLQIQIVYKADGTDDATRTAKIGQEGALVSVHPAFLLEAVTLWRNGADDNPSDLMDRIEQILDDGSTGWSQ